MDYSLILPQGVITENRGSFVGSQTHGIWSPCNPVAVGGWKAGDTLIVICTFDLNPNTSDLPDASEYYGLSAAALNNPTANGIQGVINKMKRQSAGIVEGGITQSATPNNNTDIFYNAVSNSESIPLTPSSRGTIQNIVYKWTMDYNANYVNVNPINIELIYGYGDPMLTESLT
jgi:hypothetical protein